MQLSDATLSDGPLAKHTSTQPRFHYLPAKSNVEYVWRQAIDVNGDGRVDIVDASEQDDRWVVYLNTPGPQGTVNWQRRSYSVTALRATLKGFGHIVPNDHVPLAKKATGSNLRVWECWEWSNGDWHWYSEGFANHRCQGVDGGLDGSSVERGNERTFIEWEFKDINGDGYPDIAFNSTPVTYQLHARPACPTSAHDNDVCSGAVGQKTLVPFAPLQRDPGTGRRNSIRAMFNVLGVRFYTDDDPFAQSFDLAAAGAEEGVEQWACSHMESNNETACPDDSLQSQVAGLVDVNGDGVVDRVVGRSAFLGLFAGTGATFSSVYLTLPGPLATQRSTHAAACEPGSATEATAEQIQGLRDLTGDGIPDYVDLAADHRAWIGTGAAFLHDVDIVVSGADFHFSKETELCDGRASITNDGLFDIDGDGRPEVVSRDGNTWRVAQLTTGAGAGAPEAGRLTRIDNGYGGVTHIAYVSAKTFTDNPVPFPEMVVSAVNTAGTFNLGGTIAGTRYAYGNAELVYDSVQDRFAFPGYRRSIELRLAPAPRLADGATDRTLIGAATVTDRWPLTSFQPGLGQHDRWLRTARTGHVRDLLRLRGSSTLDPWALLGVDASDTRVIGGTHVEWDARLFESPPDAADGLRNCIEMVDPLDFQTSLANAGAGSLDVCRARGFVFGTSTQSWYGGSPPPSSNNVQTRTQALAVDDFGRITTARYDNDLFRSDDDYCIVTTFASPATIFPRVLTAVAAREVIDCEKRNAYASESFEYDQLPYGAVSAGHVTAHTVDRRETSTGALIGSVRVFDAVFDATGNLASLRTERDGATRTVGFEYDAFGVLPLRTSIDATGIPAMSVTLDVDPVSLAVLGVVDPRQVRRGADFDGFGRRVRSWLALPDGTSGVVATARYDGDDGVDPQGRRTTLTRYMDPVPAAALAGAEGRSATTYLDELGRMLRVEVALGPDYGNETLVVGAHAYDAAGRVAFIAEPHAKSAPASPYGTTYYYKNTGEPDCVIHGSGPQAFTQVTDVPNERYPQCFDTRFVDHAMLSERRDASSLQPNSAQEGVVRHVTASAIGRTLSRSTSKGAAVLEYASFARDPLGRLTSVTRFLTPATPADPVQWSRRLDSLGQTLQLTEPEAAPRNFEYSNWGEITGVYWTEGTTERRIASRFDALGRLVGADERDDGNVDPATVRWYSYDLPADLSPYGAATFVLGRLAQAGSPNGRVDLSYDAVGHVDAEVFRDADGSAYVNTFGYHLVGPMATLRFRLPDGNYAEEVVKYEYDTAGRLRNIAAADPAGAQTLYAAQDLDPLGHVRKALYGQQSVLAADYAEAGRQLVREVEVRSPFGSRRTRFATFDASGRESARLEYTDGIAGSPKFAQYDALGRLAAVQGQGSTPTSWQFDYDALGNITRLHDGLDGKSTTLSYRTDDRDRICRVEYGDALTGSACNVSYDATGSMTHAPTRAGSRDLGYFAFGGLRTLTEGDVTAQLAYDAFGRLERLDMQSASSANRRHDRHFGDLIERRDVVSGNATSTQIVRRILGPGGIVASRPGADGGWIFSFGELRGNRVFVDYDGTFVQSVDYEPYGEARSTGAQPGNANYTSEQWNGGDTLALGVTQLGPRLYDPMLGRFSSRDPHITLRGSANPYAFGENDPLNAADPAGLDCLGEGCRAWTPIVPPAGPSLAAFGSVFFDYGRSAPVAPAVSAGPQTEGGKALRQEAELFLGYAPHLNWDTLAKTGVAWRTLLDNIDSISSPERDSLIDFVNADLDVAASNFRGAGIGALVGGTLIAGGAWVLGGVGTASGATGVVGATVPTTGATVTTTSAVTTAAQVGAVVTPPAVIATEEYGPELSELISTLSAEEGVAHGMSVELAPGLQGQLVALDEALGTGGVNGRFATEFARDLARLLNDPQGTPGYLLGSLPYGASSVRLTEWGQILYDYSVTEQHIYIRGLVLRFDPFFN